MTPSPRQNNGWPGATCSELSGVVPHGLRELAQTLFIQRGQVQLVHQKRIGMADANALDRQGLLREIIQVEGDDQICSALDGGCQNMAVIRVR